MAKRTAVPVPASDVTGNPKHQGIIIGQYEGLLVFVNDLKPKTARGARRLYLSVRQTGTPRFRMETSLAYPHNVDLRFVETTRTP
jgi:hypothetical protein